MQPATTAVADAQRRLAPLAQTHRSARLPREAQVGDPRGQHQVDRDERGEHRRERQRRGGRQRGEEQPECRQRDQPAGERHGEVSGAPAPRPAPSPGPRRP